MAYLVAVLALHLAGRAVGATPTPPLLQQRRPAGAAPALLQAHPGSVGGLSSAAAASSGSGGGGSARSIAADAHAAYGYSLASPLKLQPQAAPVTVGASSASSSSPHVAPVTLTTYRSAATIVQLAAALSLRSINSPSATIASGGESGVTASTTAVVSSSGVGSNRLFGWLAGNSVRIPDAGLPPTTATAQGSASLPPAGPSARGGPVGLPSPLDGALDAPVPLVVADDRFLTFQALVNLLSKHRLLVFYR
jgi:hypothetical protein